MTLEERVEFLHHSIESHDRQIAELVDSQAETRAQMKETDARLKELAAQMKETDARLKELAARMLETGTQMRETDARLRGFGERTQFNFDRLTAAMAGLTEYVANHERRFDRLEE